MKAKRGDIAVIVTERRDSYINGPTQVRTEVEIKVITSITREGLVKAVRGLGSDSPAYPFEQFHARRVALYIVSAAEFDVAGAIESARKHTYPNSDTPRAYDSLTEAKDMLRAHRLDVPAN